MTLFGGIAIGVALTLSILSIVISYDTVETLREIERRFHNH